MKEKIISLRSEGKTYIQIQELLGCSKSTIAYHCCENQREKSRLRRKRCIYNKKNNIQSPPFLRPKKIRHCKNCNGVLKKSWNKNFCSQKCFLDFTYNDYILKWKSGERNGGNPHYGSIFPTIRKYIFEKFNFKCSKCGWAEINKTTGKIPLEIDHINGDISNNTENNLDLLCPNCHSLTEGHSTNKKNGRRYFRQKYHAEKSGSAANRTLIAEGDGVTVRWFTSLPSLPLAESWASKPLPYGSLPCFQDKLNHPIRNLPRE